MNKMKLIPGANYYELYIINGYTKLSEECESFTIGLDEKIFYSILSKIDKNKFKFFQREYKEYQHKDIACQCFLNDEVKVFRTVPINIIKNDYSIILASNRSKLTLVNFPSTKNLEKISYIKKLIFRVSNRIYINFEIAIDISMNTNKIYSVYINYNHEDNVDFSIINKSINDILGLLSS